MGSEGSQRPEPGRAWHAAWVLLAGGWTRVAARGPPPAQCLRGMLGRLSHGPEGRGGRGGADGGMGAVLGRAAGPPNCFLTVQGGLPSREQPPIPGKSCRHVHPGQLGSGAFPLHCLKELSGVNMEKASWVRAADA